MEARYRFLRTRSNITGYADVTIRALECDAHTVTWCEEPRRLFRLWGSAVLDGVALAHREHVQRGGAMARIEIVGVMELIVDTRADAMRCAAAVATWKALEHDEAEVVIEYVEEWTVRFIVLFDDQSQRLPGSD